MSGLSPSLGVARTSASPVPRLFDNLSKRWEGSSGLASLLVENVLLVDNVGLLHLGRTRGHIASWLDFRRRLKVLNCVKSCNYIIYLRVVRDVADVAEVEASLVRLVNDGIGQV